MGKKVAYVELNTTNQICTLTRNRKNAPFSYIGIRIFPCITVTSLSEILALDFDYFVLDMGILNTYTSKEFFKCNKRFIVSSLCKWKKEYHLEKMKSLHSKSNQTEKDVTIICNLCTKKSSPSMISFPFIENPFHLKPSVFHAFYQILERQYKPKNDFNKLYGKR